MLKVMVTLDGSNESLEVLPTVEKLAEGNGASVHLFTVALRARSTSRGPSGVVSPLGAVAGVPAVPGGLTVTVVGQQMDQQWNESDDQAIERVISEGRAQLETIAGPLREKGIEVETQVTVHENASTAIIEHARANSFDLLAMSTHGRTGFRELVQGSVAASVVRSGVAPVLLVRPRRVRD